MFTEMYVEDFTEVIGLELGLRDIDEPEMRGEVLHKEE